MPIKTKDFIEIEFTGKTKEGKVFDSNIKEDLTELNPKSQPKPFIFCIGQGMFLKGVEDFLIDKEVGEYNLELTPEKAFGKREPKLVQIIPMRIFKEQKLNPIPGASFNFDGKMGKVLTVSGGRTIVDFNNPLAGKDIIYKIKVLRKVGDLNEKIKSFNDFLFRKDLKFKIQDKKLILETEPGMKQFIELFKDKFKEVFSLDLEVREVKEEALEHESSSDTKKEKLKTPKKSQ
ncbi:MAG: peptidylprolyl isomerase [archaeon]